MQTWGKIQPWRISHEGGQMHHRVHDVLSEIRIKGVGRKGVSCVYQLPQFCACPQPLQEQDQLDFKLLNQHCVLGEYLPGPFACRMLTQWQGGHLIVWDGTDTLVFTFHVGKETANNFVTRFTRVWLSKTVSGRILNYLFINSTFITALFCQCSC